jgi:uncharacterized protein YbjQ (UPF0145 family)
MKRTAKRKFAGKRVASKQFALATKKKLSARRKGTNTGLHVEWVPLSSGERREPRDVLSGDLQALSNQATANSESVEELLKEGNALEAEAVQGVENALDADQGEVQTREVLEDDVPQEYLDKDQ